MIRSPALARLAFVTSHLLAGEREMVADLDHLKSLIEASAH
jgi:hypothetical protein